MLIAVALILFGVAAIALGRFLAFERQARRELEDMHTPEFDQVREHYDVVLDSQMMPGSAGSTGYEDRQVAA